MENQKIERKRFYHVLDESKNQFRLLRLVSSRPPLSWELRTMSIYDGVPWYALSYRWGHSEPTKTITLNGLDFAVTSNLYSFLAQIANEDRRDWFFVDAICIDQLNILERSSQVRLMRDIYRNAEEVIAWVYHDDDNASNWADLESWHELLQDIQQKGTMEASKAARWRVKVMNMVRLRAFCSTYWSRLWIVQEILLAKKLVIRWLTLTIEWSDILSLEIDGETVPSIELTSEGRPLKSNNTMASRKADLWKHDAVHGSGENAIMCKQLFHWKQSAGDDLRDGKLLAFHEAVEFFSVQNCRHAHDSVFGLLGIAHSNIRPTYSMPILDLYAKSLCGCLLSRWSERPITADSTNSSSDDWDFLISRGVDRNQLDSLGNRLLHSLQLDPFNEVVFLLTSHICNWFASGRALLEMLFTLFRSRVMAIKHFRLETLKFYDTGSPPSRRLNDSEDEVVQKLNDALLHRCKEAETWQNVLRAENGKMKAPDADGREMRRGAWLFQATSICDEGWKFVKNDFRQGNPARLARSKSSLRRKKERQSGQ